MTESLPEGHFSWTNPSPIFKQTMTVGAFVIAIAIELLAPGLGVADWMWFSAGVATLLVATAVAAAITTRHSRWHWQGIAWALDFIAVGLLGLGSGPDFSPVSLLAVLPVLLFAGMRGVIFLAYSTVGVFVALVLPLLIETTESAQTLWLGIFGVIVFSNVGWIFHQVTLGQQKAFARQQELGAVHQQLLQDSLARTEELQRSRADLAGTSEMLQGVWRAVTEQAIIATDLVGQIAHWNPGAEKMFGYTELDVADVRDIADFLAPEQTDAADAFAALLGSTGADRASTAEWTMVRKDGSLVPVQLSVTPRFDESGAQIGYLFVAHDVSEAREVAKLKDEFVGLISHELRTPLSSIIGYLELLRDEDEDPLSDGQLHYLSVAERNAHRLLHLVGDLLFAAQVESGSFHLAKSTLELVPLVAASVETARPIADVAGVTLVLESSESITVEGDPTRLGQAVDNLVSNAVKFTPRGGTVTLSLAAGADTVVLSVRDTGVGIAASELDKLFSRFFRATTATANAVPGVGLGLTITKAIILAHDGSMTVESEEGVGTTFSVTLPLARS